ncbi:MAG: hypothetical protein ACKORY_12720, partial [Actinomycetota bacterium]
MSKAWLRRTVTVTVLGLIDILVTLLAPVWAVLFAVYDLARGKRRMPTVRLMTFGLLWAWIETAGVCLMFLLWATGRTRNHGAHYRTQRWWCGRIIAALRVTVGLRVTIIGTEHV